MDYREIELWIKNNILKNNFSLSFLPQNEKIFEQRYFQNFIDLTDLNGKLNFIGEVLELIDEISKKTINNCVLWFKVNFIDNAIPDLVGIGKISDFSSMTIFSHLLTLDTPAQNGDSVICLFNETKEWLIKMEHCRDENKICIRTYGKGKVIELLK